MSIRISGGSVPLSIARHGAEAQAQVNKSLGALSSGSRVEGGDDAASFAISENLRAQIAGTKRGKLNADSAQSLLQTAEGGLGEQNNILVRLRELAVSASSDTVGDEERGFLNNEFRQLSSEFDRIAKTTRFGQKQLLTGSGEEFAFHVGPFGDENNTIRFKLNADSTGRATGVSSLDVADKGSALDSLGDLDRAIQKVAGVRATFGAMQARLGHASDALDVQAENLEAARGRLADVDVAEESTKLAQAQVRSQTNLALLAQANQSGARVARLLE